MTNPRFNELVDCLAFILLGAAAAATRRVGTLEAPDGSPGSGASGDSEVRERNADEALTEATLSAYEISQKWYRAGRDSYLNVLDSQRSDYAAKQRLIAVRLAEQSNRVTLYKALGGGWLERSR